MKNLRKVFVTIGLVCSMMFITPTISRADMTGAGDAALLAQQFAQFIQDFELDEKKWTDIEARLNEVHKITSTITKGSQAYTSVHNIYKSEKQIIRTYKDFERYISYLKEFGNNFQITRAHSIYNSFMRRSKTLLDDASKTLKIFEGLHDLKPLELLNAVDGATTSVSESVTEMRASSTEEVATICHEAAMEQVVEENQKFKKLNIGS